MFFQDATAQELSVTSVPAPIGGLNARDSLVAMPATDAIRLTNFWPQSYGVTVRKGYKKHATGMVDKLGTVGQWSSTTGFQKMFAWAGTSVWDITTPGPVGVPVITDLSNSRWDLVSLVNASGSHLLGVNGADDGFAYDESGLHVLVAGDGTTAYTWSGIDPKNATNIEIHQRRLWAVEKDSSVGWYLPPDAIYGVFQSFDFGPLFFNGGYLEYLSTWTLDDGNGAEDHLVAVSNNGVAAVYGGTDPSDDTKWHLVGVYNIGQPVRGRRALAKVGGDLYILTTQGVVSMVNMLSSTKVNEAAARFKTDKVQFLLSELVNNYSDEEDWQLIYVPSINMLVVNVPTGIYASNQQLVSNQITEAWAMFNGMDAAVWTTVSAQPFFGDYAGTVYKAWTGGLDNIELDDTGGTSITTEVQQAYNYFGSPGSQKQIGLYRVNWVSSQPVAYNSAILYDFGSKTLITPDAIPRSVGALWNVALWGVDTWGGGSSTERNWSGAEGMGVAASILIKSRSNADAMWVTTDYSFVNGGLL